jgi:undecaprenyl pyrophosphate phosphatase UppP
MEEAIVVPFIVFSTMFGVIYVIVTARHRERIAMIEAGMNPNDSKSPQKKRSRLSIGLLLLFVPLGIFIGNVIGDVYPIVAAEPLAIIFAFLFGGVALLVSYFIESKRQKSEDLTQKEID